ncbi:MAG: hypothetical protein EBZ77_02310, partial [Chitinophagia bacterium]|nr:hypothetical protein [Chitinophagia bacterium]
MKPAPSGARPPKSMNKKHIITLCCLLLVVSLRAQILPKEDRLLNYRIVGFSFPNEANASAGYTLQIAVGKHYSTDSFHKYLIESLPLSTNKAIVELPAFGLFYTWRVAPKGDSNELAKATLHHFGVGTTEMVDPTKARVRILHKAEDHKDAYVFFDGNKALYDMEGRPVWYFPLVDNHVSYAGQITDLKMTPQGTISFLYNDQRAYNITYSGEVLWKGEFNDIFAEDTHYHHELCRLNNGHYMVLGTERAYWKPHQPSGKGQPLYDIAFQGPDRLKPAGYDSTFPFTNIYEYDAAGKRLWTWRFAEYFPKSDLYYHNSPDTGRYSFDPHPNAFYF